MNTYPKEAGAGGIIFHPGGNIVSSYAWGLGQKTNNEVQCLALFFGMNLARELNISKITILGNSKQVIYKMNNGYSKAMVKIKKNIRVHSTSHCKSSSLLSLHPPR